MDSVESEGEDGDGGSIVNVSSIAASQASPIEMIYGAAKAGMHNLTKSFARAFAPKVRVNCIMPGFINTPMAIETIIGKTGIDRAELIRMRDSAVPMGKMGDAWDVAYAALFLASEEAKFVTGVSLTVDGGQCLKS